MKKIITSFLTIMAFDSAYVSAQESNIWTFNRLDQSTPKLWKDERVQINESVLKSQTITLTETKDQLEQPAEGGNVYKDNLYSAAQLGATAAGLGLTYLYGPTALFWGTYYGSSYLLAKVGIEGLTALSAATNAAMMIGNSPVAKAALVTVGGFVAKHGATVALKAAEITSNIALAGGKSAVNGTWSLGNYAYNRFWGSTTPTQEEGPKSISREEMREAALRAAESRIVN
ncbi:hypothetical protein [Candidatus Paracaedibacter symbiosus]|uniref:hypothetical protein n=1 Tax=Candidatus Paracaedibacter symbiosus TaxID=244582 RepID=UPI000509A9AD|nr:hypothetical protein [Candidatus Paracaedibacter symbiosus]